MAETAGPPAVGGEGRRRAASASLLALALASACTRRSPPVATGRAVDRPTPTVSAAPSDTGSAATVRALPDGGVVVQTAGGPVRLPAPYATRSVTNPQRVVRRPDGASLRAAAGLRVTEFAMDTASGRWLALAPNGDVFVSQHDEGAVLVLRDADRDGRAEARFVFARGLALPFGMAFHPDGWLYVANTDGVVRFAYRPGQTAAAGRPERVAPLPGRGYNQHWTRNVVFAPDHQTMFVSVGSETNADPEDDPRRAAISAFAPDGRNHRVYASGLRNPIGMAFHPDTGVLYTVVNERDELGDDLVPDYLTSVREGAFYGWPYAYFGPNPDPRLAGQRPDLVARAVVPNLALGAHVAALGLLFYTGAMLPPEYRGDALIALHGSWNRAQPVGYKVVRARFRDGRPTGEVEDFVTGFRTDQGVVWGRPVGLLQMPDGAVLVADDGANAIWRVAR